MEAIKQSRIRNQVFDFIKSARSSGIESDWIKMINGKPVAPERVEQLDQLIQNVLSNKTQVHIRDSKLPHANLIRHHVTNQNIIEYEIPKPFREKIKKEALKESPNDIEKAKAVYHQRMSAVRRDLLREHAVKTTQSTIPPIKTKLDQKNPFVREANVAPEDYVSYALAHIKPDPEFPQYDIFIEDLRKEFLKLQQETPEKLFKDNIAPHLLFNNKIEPQKNDWSVFKDREFAEKAQKFARVVGHAYAVVGYQEKPVNILEIPEFHYYAALLQRIIEFEQRKVIEGERRFEVMKKLSEEWTQYTLDLVHKTPSEFLDEWPDIKAQWQEDLIKHKWFKWLVDE